MAGSGKNNANKSREKKKESVPVRNPKKEAVGVCLMGLALILLGIFIYSVNIAG